MRFSIRKGVRLIAEGLGLKKIAQFGGFPFFFQQHKSVSRSLNIRVLAYSQERLIGEEIQYIKVTLIHESVNE